MLYAVKRPTFNRPARLDVRDNGAICIVRKRGAHPPEARWYHTEVISDASRRRVVRLFEADIWTQRDEETREYRLLGRISADANLHLNDYGVEVTDSGDIPDCCLGCTEFEDYEFGYDGELWAQPFCRSGVFFPRRKGTCATKTRIMAKPPVMTIPRDGEVS